MAKKRYKKSEFGMPHLVVIAVALIVAVLMISNNGATGAYNSYGDAFIPILTNDAELVSYGGLESGYGDAFVPVFASDADIQYLGKG